MFHILQDQEPTFVDNGQALHTHRSTARSDYHRLLGHGIFTMLLLAVAEVEIWHLFP